MQYCQKIQHLVVELADFQFHLTQPGDGLQLHLVKRSLVSAYEL